MSPSRQELVAVTPRGRAASGIGTQTAAMFSCEQRDIGEDDRVQQALAELEEHFPW